MTNSKSFAFTIILCSTSLFATSQDYVKQFKTLQSKQDTASQIRLLKTWETAAPKDPELFITYFNYYAQQSMKEMLSIDLNAKAGQAIEMNDPKTGQPVAYLNSSVNYRSDILQKGFDYIDKGIALYPTRLDMKFGRIYMLGQAENYAAFTKMIIETIDYANSINYAFTWKEGKQLENPKQFFLSSLQDYNNTLYNTENDNLLPNMREIAEAVLKYNPNHVESLSNAALTYLLTEKYDKALEYLLKAEKVAPKDVVILNNIAQAYKRKNDKPNAKIYLGKILKVGNKEEVENAKDDIKNLDN